MKLRGPGVIMGGRAKLRDGRIRQFFRPAQGEIGIVLEVGDKEYAFVFNASECAKIRMMIETDGGRIAPAPPQGGTR